MNSEDSVDELRSQAFVAHALGDRQGTLPVSAESLLTAIAFVGHAVGLSPTPLDLQQTAYQSEFNVFGLGSRKFRSEQVFFGQLVEVDRGILPPHPNALKREVHAVEQAVDLALKVVKCVP